MFERLTTFNQSMNDLPRKLLIILAVIAVLFLGMAILPFVAPFVVAALLSAMIEPLVRLLSKLFGRLRFHRTLAAAISTFFMLALLLTLCLVIFSSVFTELKALAYAMPTWATTTVERLLEWVNGLDFEWELLDDTLRDYIQDVIISLGRSITGSATTLASILARGVWNTATVMLPKVLLFTTLTFMGTFYMSSDRKGIGEFLSKLVPSRLVQSSALVKANIFKAILSQVRAQLIMMLVTFTELIIGFSIIRMDYMVLLALLISVLDALPVLGTGLFLVPFAIYGLIVGNYPMAIGMVLLYLVIGIVRQSIEPRILGKHMGLHPLATMMSMYAGYWAIGFAGMILGPMVLLLCKVVVAHLTPPPEEALPQDPPPAVQNKAKKKRKLKR